MTETILTQLASTGVVGALLVVALVALQRKDQEAREESRARVEDSQRFLTLAVDLQAKVTQAVHALTEIVDKWERREEERERLVRETALRVPTPPPIRPVKR